MTFWEFAHQHPYLVTLWLLIVAGSATIALPSITVIRTSKDGR